MVQGSESGVQSSGFRVQGSESGVQGSPARPRTRAQSRQRWAPLRSVPVRIAAGEIHDARCAGVCRSTGLGFRV